MYIPYEKIGLTLRLFFPKQSNKIWDYFYNKKIERNCAYISKNKKRVFKRLKNKFNKKPLKVVFYVQDSTKWKSQTIYDLMVKDSRFEPLIVATKCCAMEKTVSYQTKEDVKKLYDFFKERNMNVEYGYDIEKDSYIPFEKFKPDIILYGQPWYIERSQGPVVCSKFALTYYIPYFLANTSIYIEYDLRFHQYIHKHYVLNDLIKKDYHQKQERKANNIVAIGHPQLDYFYLNKNNTHKKSIIYSPHWSVGTKDGLCYSTFLENGKYILEFAQKHPEIDWIFKPHPVLPNQLTDVTKLWSKEKVEEYYNEWRKIGKVYTQGDYLDLFNESYAMITDCGSFLTEFFMTEQPVIHLVSPHASEYNDSVKKIVKSYYQAHNIEELEKYLQEVILDKKDPKKQERLKVLEELGLKNNYCAQRILEDIEGELNA